MSSETRPSLTLMTAPPALGVGCASPFALKADVLLQMSGRPFERERADPRKGPKNKVPWLIHRRPDGSEQVIADSTFIQRYLEREFDVDFDGHLNAAEQARAELVRISVDEFLYWAQLRVRWELHPQEIKAAFFGPVPRALRGLVFAMIARQVRKDLRSQGLGRHSLDELMSLTRPAIAALSTAVGDSDFLFGDAPTSADAALYAFVENTLAPEVPSPLAEQVRSFGNLVAHTERMAALYAVPSPLTSPSKRSKPARAKLDQKGLPTPL